MPMNSNSGYLDGMTGEARLQFSDHTSRTLHEYPTIADVDNDGSAEIIIVNGGAHTDPVRTGLAVLGSRSSNWPLRVKFGINMRISLPM